MSDREQLIKTPKLELHDSVLYLRELENAPQGRHLGLFSTIVLFVSRILGTGIFSISSGIYEDCGRSPALFFAAWLVAAIMAFCGLCVYLELGSLVPRSGGTKVFLEYIYDRPRLLASVTFLVFSIISGFTITNCLVIGEYLLRSLGIETNDSRIRLTGLFFVYLTAAIHGLSMSHGVLVQNFIGGLKLGLMGFMIITGFYVLFFPTSVSHIDSNLTWDNFFPLKAEVTSSLFASGVIKASFAFSGWNAVHTVSNEVKNPVRVFKIAGPTSLLIALITYVFTNLAYLIVIPDEEFANGKTLVGSLLFEHLFGEILGRKILTFSIFICAAGNLFVVMYTISRTSQECFREGYLPFSSFMSSNWPRGAPLPTLILSVLFTTLVLTLTPSGDIYSYIISLEGYPQTYFTLGVAIGIFIIRKRYPDVIAPIRAPTSASVVTIIISSYLIISPLATTKSPNPKGLENWPSYAYLGLFILLLCSIYWVFLFKLLPWFYGYTLVQEEIEHKDGLTVKKWVKVENSQFG
ncbi:amino acid transporter [Suhomyces tanzawaensis NRRL Y-17324]|uniref:Amino acid transporter n=1 Tax=Suhomyces tanzawaensis NRRL Y-17324 TaxID=984487 RepID=A0A1E4SNI5_9ASCO|nr:amino acid transporter [Suhomyces tanzawaensis NRRL Y-17324]ODV81048.1 amino acid transporter [Suhomyces tanzawaensis NRRL Y-17324]